MLSPDATTHLPAADKAELLALARQSIEYGLEHAQVMPIQVDALPEQLRPAGASFVTLTLGGTLRGCIGTLEAKDPLGIDVVQNAFAAAFRDPRFPELRRAEWKDVDIHISILSASLDIHCDSELDLIRQLRPGTDGLILSEGRRHATFLPSVWEQLPEAEAFIHHLKLKGGWAPDYWSEELRAERYTVEEVS